MKTIAQLLAVFMVVFFTMQALACNRNGCDRYSQSNPRQATSSGQQSGKSS